MKKNIAVVYGGFSSEHDISVKSGKYVASVIDHNLFNVYQVHLSRDKWLAEDKYPIKKEDFSFTKEGEIIHFDAAVILIHGTPGEDGILQSYFNLIGLPYVSCNPLASDLTFNKYYCNHYLHDMGITISKSIILRKDDIVNTQEIISRLGLPVFVKPDAGGSSFGTHKVKHEQELITAIESARKESDEVIIEKFIPGTEITVGVIKYKGKIQALTPCEIRSKKEFFDYDAKYNPQLNEEIIPARIPDDKIKEVMHLAEKIYRHLNCNGIVRIDFILSDEDNKFYFLELNSIPGMTQASIVPKMLRYDKINITDLYTSLIEEAIARE